MTHEQTIDPIDTTPDTDTPAPTAPTRALRGFAVMSPEARRELAARGGKAAHAAGTAHQFTHEEAVAAGKKGGTAPHRVRGRGRRNSTGS